MFIRFLSNHRINLFTVLILVVFFSQILILRPIIGQGMTNEDYAGLYEVRTYNDRFFTDPVGMWEKIGTHNAAHDFYLAILGKLFGENYTSYLYATIFFKIIATLLVYPLILLISKNKLLAFLSALLYGFSYPSTGALYLYVVGNEYLGVALMNLFLIMYYLTIQKTGALLLVLTSLSVTLAYLASSIRIYPVFLIILMIELFIVLRNKFSGIFASVFRMLAVFLPTILISLSNLGNSGADAYGLAGLPDFLKLITNGNWFLLLNPLWGLGYLFLPAANLNIFTPINIASLSSYLISLFHTPVAIFAVVSAFLSFAIASRSMRFFIVLMSIDLLLDIAIFILYTHHFGISPNLRQEYSGPSFTAGLYAGILGGFVISISITCLLEWYLSGRKNNLLFLSFIAPFISMLFIISQWVFTRQYYMYQEGIHRYFVIPAIGAYIFVASLMTLALRSKRNERTLFALIAVFILFQVFNISKNEIAQVFYGKRNSGKELQVQRLMQDQMLSYIPKDKIKDDLIIFFKFKSPTGNANQWEDTFDWRDLSLWFHVRRSYLTNRSVYGCVAVTWDYQEMQKMAETQAGIKGFLYQSGGNKEERCLHDGVGYSMDGKLINIDNFYAFEVDGLNVVDITKQVESKIVF